MVLGEKEELEAELIQRNREVAKQRDELQQKSGNIKEHENRNDLSWERHSMLEAKVTMQRAKVSELEAKREMERSKATSKLEVERLRHSLDIEAQSRVSAERIAQSRLEEKDCLLDLKAAELETVKADLEQARQRNKALETEATRAREENEARVHALTLRCARFEAELRSKHKQVAEMEGRLEEQRSYFEQLHKQLHKAQMDRVAMLQTQASLEAQLKLEQSYRDAVAVSLQQAQEAATKRCLEVEEQMDKDRVSGLEAELLSSKQRCEHLVRNKADLQQELAKRAAFQAAQAEELEVARQAASSCVNEEDGRSLRERLAMSQEELRTRQADFSYERQWLTGALEDCSGLTVYALTAGNSYAHGANSNCLR